jgi:hypothetical protein
MQITFHPKGLLLTVAAVVALSAIFSLATDVNRAGILGIAALLAYVLFEVFFSVNPAAWWRSRR